VVLFDEIEKAHSDVFNLFLQILDEGHLTDSQGRTVSFKNVIIIMTSNIGSPLILQAKKITQEVQREIEKLLHQHFRPEFLNRVDETVYFRSLQPEDMLHIVQVQLKGLFARLHQKGVALVVAPEAMKKLAELGYVQEFGARPLKRALQQYLVSPLAVAMLKEPEKKSFAVELQQEHLVIL
jgi:ATP-dependent Clp protease ATP-binding subunit ClpB